MLNYSIYIIIRHVIGQNFHVNTYRSQYERGEKFVKNDQNHDILIFFNSSNVSYWESFNVSFFLNFSFNGGFFNNFDIIVTYLFN